MLDLARDQKSAVGQDAMAPEPEVRYRAAKAGEQVDRLVALIDGVLTRQVNAILHHPAFQAFEARWRGLAYLVEHASAVSGVSVKVLSVSWRELCRDLDRSVEFDQSRLFELVYGQEFGMPGGEPYGLLIGDYAVGHKPDEIERTDDVGALRTLAGIAAAAFAPFLVQARPELLELDSFADLDLLPEMTHVFEGAEFIRWQSLRSWEDSRFLGIAAPRVLMRPPLTPHDRRRIDGFMFEETVTADGRELLWGNPVFVFARVVVRAFAQSGWFADLRGAPQDQDAGGLVTDLPSISFSTDRAGLAAQPPVEIRLTSAQERALSEHGLVPIGCAPGTPYLVLNANPSLHRPARSQSRIADENARLAAMLQYVLCASRFAHYLKVMMRDRVGSVGSAAAIEEMISTWLARYCLGSDDASPDLKARFPLREASVAVREMPGRPGVLGCVLRLQPHFQLDDVSASFQLVAEVSTTTPV